jgi:hypothetical protein
MLNWLQVHAVPPSTVCLRPSSQQTSPTPDSTLTEKLRPFTSTVQRLQEQQPRQQSQQCLPFSLLKKMLERPIAHLAIFIVFHQLMLLGFFFAMRSFKNVKVSGERRTHPLRKRNMVFRKGGRILPHSSPRLHLADTITITFEYQKRDKRNNTVTQWRTGDSTYCPVVVSAAVVRRLEAMGASKSDFIYKFKGDDGRTRDFDSATALWMLRGFISSVDFKGLGLNPKRIRLHSLQLLAAMAMYLNGVPVYTIMLLGCWSSDAFLRYIRKQVESFGSGVLSKMIVTSRFLHVSHSTDLEDPRTSRNPADTFPRGIRTS